MNLLVGDSSVNIMFMKNVNEIVEEIEKFLLENGGYDCFKIGKSSQSEKEITERYGNEWNASVKVKILDTGTRDPKEISKLETGVIEKIKNDKCAWGVYLRNENSISSGNDEADQLYVVMKN